MGGEFVYANKGLAAGCALQQLVRCSHCDAASHARCIDRANFDREPCAARISAMQTSRLRVRCNMVHDCVVAGDWRSARNGVSDMSEMTREQMQAELNAMRAQIEAMKADAARKLTLKVSERGVVCVYGLGQRPVSLYASQWEALIPFVKSGAVERFITANAAIVARKATATA